MLTTVRAFLGDERIRFLLVGGINTLVGYGLFVLFQLTLGHVIGYLGSLYASYAVATTLAFVLHRRFTFRARGSVALDYLRFQIVYVVALAVNTILLPVLVELVGLEPIVAQACIVVLTTILSYVGHKFFSFRRPSGDARSNTTDATEPTDPKASRP